MTIRQTTQGKTEADLEAEIHGAIKRAFPFLPDGSITHQTTFVITFGHKKIVVGKDKPESAYARLDILLSFKDKPLAILELKREGLDLDDEDCAQGLSYARLLQPSPPLVVLTNGLETRLIETHTGLEWTPKTPSETAFTELVKSATKASQHDLKLAIDTLMGTNPEIWVQAIRHTSDDVLKELTGNFDDIMSPFVTNFLIPRAATKWIFGQLGSKARLILLEGAPLVGKSNVLRELVSRTAKSKGIVVLFVEGYTDVSIFQQIAYILSTSLSWPVTANEVRSWLLRLSQDGATKLVLAVDGVPYDHAEIRANIEELTSPAFGDSLKVVVAVDDSIAEQLVMQSNGRQLSVIGRRAKRGALKPLADSEFALAEAILSKLRINIHHGGRYCAEYRLPWVIRLMLANITRNPGYEKEGKGATLPPLLGLTLIQFGRKLVQTAQNQSRLQSVAKAILDDAIDWSRSPELCMQCCAEFTVRREKLRHYLGSEEIKELEQQGYLLTIPPIEGDDVLIVRVPELVACELTTILATRLAKDLKDGDPELVAYQLSGLATAMPFGDVIAAASLIELSSKNPKFDIGVITELHSLSPERESMKPGQVMGLLIPGRGMFNFTVRDDGQAEGVIDDKLVEFDVKDTATTCPSDRPRRIVLPEGMVC